MLSKELSSFFCFFFSLVFLDIFLSQSVTVVILFATPGSTATNVEIELPVPSDSTNSNARSSMGSASYAPEKDALVWKIKSFPGGKVL